MKKGFTLAEVLITLGVIGVIAALTMPNLLQNHQKRVFVTQLQRTFNMISNAATQLMADDNSATLADSYLVAVTSGSGDDATTDYDNAQGQFLNHYFKVARDCKTDDLSGCLGDKYFSLDRSKSFDLVDDIEGDGFYCVSINNGATVCMTDMQTSTETNDAGNALKRAEVIIDVNGVSGPNTNGRDLYSFYMYEDGRMGNYYKEPANSDDDEVTDDCTEFDGDSYGGTCFQKVMADGWVMNY